MLCLQFGLAVGVHNAQAMARIHWLDDIFKWSDGLTNPTEPKPNSPVKPRDQGLAESLRKAALSKGFGLAKQIKLCEKPLRGDHRTEYVLTGPMKRECIVTAVSEYYRPLNNKEMLLHIVLWMPTAIDYYVPKEELNVYIKVVLFKLVDALPSKDLCRATMDASEETDKFGKFIIRCRRVLTSRKTEDMRHESARQNGLIACYRELLLGPSWPRCSFAFIPKVACDLPPL